MRRTTLGVSVACYKDRVTLWLLANIAKTWRPRHHFEVCEGKAELASEVVIFSPFWAFSFLGGGGGRLQQTAGCTSRIRDIVCVHSQFKIKYNIRLKDWRCRGPRFVYQGREVDTERMCCHVDHRATESRSEYGKERSD